MVRKAPAVPMAPSVPGGRLLLPVGADANPDQTYRNARPEPAQPVLSDRRFCPVPESAPDAQYPHPPVRSQAEAPVRFRSCRYAHSAAPDAWAEAARQYPRTGPALLPFFAGLSASVRSLPPPSGYALRIFYYTMYRHGCQSVFEKNTPACPGARPRATPERFSRKTAGKCLEISRKN